MLTIQKLAFLVSFLVFKWKRVETPTWVCNLLDTSELWGCLPNFEIRHFKRLQILALSLKSGQSSLSYTYKSFFETQNTNHLNGNKYHNQIHNTFY